MACPSILVPGRLTELLWMRVTSTEKQDALVFFFPLMVEGASMRAEEVCVESQVTPQFPALFPLSPTSKYVFPINACVSPPVSLILSDR